MSQLLLDAEQRPTAVDGVRRRFPLKEILYVLFRHKKKILLCCLVGLMIPLGLIYKSPHIYRSEAKLLVRFISYRAAADPEATGQTLYGPRYWENVFNSELVILGGRSLAERAVDEMGPEAFLRQKPEKRDRPQGDPREAAIQYVLGNVKITTPGRSNIIGLSFDAWSPDLAQQTLDTLVKTYLRMHASIHRAAGSYEFLQQQTGAIREKLFRTEEALKKLKNEGGIISLQEKQKLLSARAVALQANIEQTETAMSSAQAKIRLIERKEKEMEAADASPGRPPPRYAGDMSTLQQRLQRLRVQELDLLTRYKPDSIPVRDVRSQIAVLKDLLDEGSLAQPFLGEGLAPAGNLAWALLQEESRLSSLQAEREVLKKQQERVDGELHDLNEMERRISQLQRDLAVQDAAYRKFSANLEQARIDQALDVQKVSNVSEVQAATYPSKMIRRINSRKVGMLFLLGSVMTGLGLAFFNEYHVDRSIRRPRDIAWQVGDTLTASIPRVRNASKKLALAAHGIEERKTLPAPSKKEPPSDSRWNLPDNVRREFELLKNDLLLSVRDPEGNGHPCLLGVTSCLRGEGVSTVAASLALTIAQSGEGRVLLVDADRSLSFQSQLGAGRPTPPGMVDIHRNGRGNTVIIQPNLYVLTGTEIAPDRPPSRAGQQVEDLVRGYADSEYDYVVFDLPPIMEEGFTARAAGVLNGVVLVVEAEKTSEAMMKNALALLRRHQAEVHGVVLNKERAYLPAWLNRKL